MKEILCLFLLGLLISCKPSQLSERVSTKNGEILGYKDEELLIYKGVPFAKPPVNDLRWQSPRPVENWDGVKECREFAASPFQPEPKPFSCWSEEFIAPPEPLSEDCLYLNIWTAAKETSEKRPVFVWIYGGGFNSGSAACAIYDGSYYARNGVVFVSLNYRVGPFGFLSHPGLTDEQNGHSGNYGLLDQIAALQWIKENIVAFGGNPDDVTIAGQSAGSMSIHALTASPLAKGLFHKAIAMSGGFGPNRQLTLLKDAEKTGLELQGILGLKNIGEMRQKSAEEILEAAGKLKTGRPGVILDGYFLHENAFENRVSQVPVLTGWTKDDGGFLTGGALTLKQYIQETREQQGNKAEDFLAAFSAQNDAEALKMRTKARTLGFAAIPARLWALNNSKPVFVYEVAHVPTDKPDFPHYGAFHTSDVPYALGNLTTWNRPWQNHDLQTEKILSSYYLNFIKTGNPNGENLPDWKPYTSENGYIQRIDNEISGLENGYKTEFSVLN